VKEATRDAAGISIRPGDVVGATTSKMLTIIGQILEITESKIKVRLERDALPAGPNRPVEGDEQWIMANRTFLVRRATTSQQVLFTSEVDDTLKPIDRQEAAWLLVRAVTGCNCTDPHPIVCQGRCVPAGKGRQCPCHYIRSTNEIRDLVSGALGANAADDFEDMYRHLAEVYCEAGHRDADAQRYAGEFLAQHARGLAALMHKVGPFISKNTSQDFGAGFSGASLYMRAYAYGLDMKDSHP